MWNFTSIIRKLMMLCMWSGAIIILTLLFLLYLYILEWLGWHPLWILVFGLHNLFTALILAISCLWVIFEWKGHAKVAKYFLKSYESKRFDDLYQTQTIPQNMSGLNEIKIDGKCMICLESLLSDNIDQNTLLICGHIFHKQCIREWELQQFTENPSKLYSCPICKTEYDWNQKFALKSDLN